MWKTGHTDRFQFGKQLCRLYQSQGILFASEMGQHHQQRKYGTHSGGKSGAHDSHVQNEHKEIVAEYVEDSAKQHCLCRKPGIAIVAQKGSH